ncbi:MAG: DUF2975 domain-containing protein [Clostridiaceae bacterium]
MENNIKVEKFKKLAKVLKVITTILFWTSKISAIVCGVVLAAINLIHASFISSIGTSFVSTISEGMKSGNGSITVELGILGFKFRPDIFSSKDMILILNTNLFNAIAVLAVSYFITLHLREILDNVIKDIPFNEQSAEHISRLGRGVIAASFLPLINMITTLIIVKTLNLQELISSNDKLVGIQFNFHPINEGLFFAGLFILLLSSIFRYGSFLQEEFDSTL